MRDVQFKKAKWTTCPDCKGQGKKSQKLQKKVRLQYRIDAEEFEKSDKLGDAPIRPKARLSICLNCSGSGLIESENFPTIDTENYPNISIIGGGIGGIALAVACLHRGIPYTLFERDENFDARSQGYGLTLQQASKAIAGFGIFNLEKGIVSSRHLVHTTNGEVIAEWGMRKWLQSEPKETQKRSNIHISRQALRLALLEQLDEKNPIQWNHQLVDFHENIDKTTTLSFQVAGNIKTFKADLVVGADGIRSATRNILIGDDITPLRYLGCLVILGICPLSAIEHLNNPLLDSATVFQTGNGNERIYMMPFDKDSIMWQLSFPISEQNAKDLTARGKQTLKEEAMARTQWHEPIPQIVKTTSASQISGYPVYDRALLKPEFLEKGKQITLIGDAAHPMSPFKGQGANQALLDALSLARKIHQACRPLSNWREIGIRKSVLTDFETEMLQRSSKKVKDSADAADFLHSDLLLTENDRPRGRF